MFDVVATDITRGPGWLLFLSVVEFRSDSNWRSVDGVCVPADASLQLVYALGLFSESVKTYIYFCNTLEPVKRQQLMFEKMYRSDPATSLTLTNIQGTKGRHPRSVRPYPYVRTITLLSFGGYE